VEFKNLTFENELAATGIQMSNSLHWEWLLSGADLNRIRYAVLLFVGASNLPEQAVSCRKAKAQAMA
jgi:hypothetical protein